MLQVPVGGAGHLKRHLSYRRVVLTAPQSLRLHAVARHQVGGQVADAARRQTRSGAQERTDALSATQPAHQLQVL